MSDASTENQQVESIDPRIRNLSYSSLNTLHSCPRKYQLYKLGSDESEGDLANRISSSITFAYGHVIGDGIQAILEGMPREQWLLRAFLFWEPDLLLANEKQNKSFWGAIHALDQFAAMRASGFLKGYKLVHYQDKPACELSFAIHLPAGFIYRGFVDVVLQHESTGKVLVLELKTTGSATVNPATYKNSAQAIGYSIVLDAIFPDLSSYEVLYLVYQAKSESYQPLTFNKSYYQRALWIRELLLDIEVIKMYEGVGIYPMRGESCFNFFKECEYYGLCTLSTERLTKVLPDNWDEKAAEELARFQIQISLEELIRAQVAKQAKSEQEPAIENTSINSVVIDMEDEIL